MYLVSKITQTNGTQRTFSALGSPFDKYLGASSCAKIAKKMDQERLPKNPLESTGAGLGGCCIVWEFLLFDPLNDLQKLCNLFYLKANFVSLTRVKAAVQNFFGSLLQKTDRTRANFRVNWVVHCWADLASFSPGFGLPQLSWSFLHPPC